MGGGLGTENARPRTAHSRSRADDMVQKTLWLGLTGGSGNTAHVVRTGVSKSSQRAALTSAREAISVAARPFSWVFHR